MWKAHPTTLAVFQALSDERSEWVQRLVLGDTLDNPAAAIIETAKHVGIIQGLTIFMEDLGLYLQQQWAEAQARKKAEESEEDYEF